MVAGYLRNGQVLVVPLEGNRLLYLPSKGQPWPDLLAARLKGLGHLVAPAG